MEFQEDRNVTDARPTDIVVGVDGSSSSKAALRWALDEARRRGARVRAVAAWEFPAYYGFSGGMPYPDFAEMMGKTLSDAVHEVIGYDQPEVEVLESVVAGHPAQALVDASAHAALVVVGSRGHGGFAGTLLGSVSQQCTQRAHCPVAVVRGTS
jgi:nucleotide-binding universal stress UspA family protein